MAQSLRRASPMGRSVRMARPRCGGGFRPRSARILAHLFQAQMADRQHPVGGGDHRGRAHLDDDAALHRDRAHPDRSRCRQHRRQGQGGVVERPLRLRFHENPGRGSAEPGHRRTRGVATEPRQRHGSLDAEGRIPSRRSARRHLGAVFGSDGRDGRADQSRSGTRRGRHRRGRHQRATGARVASRRCQLLRSQSQSRPAHRHGLCRGLHRLHHRQAL